MMLDSGCYVIFISLMDRFLYDFTHYRFVYAKLTEHLSCMINASVLKPIYENKVNTVIIIQCLIVFVQTIS